MALIKAPIKVIYDREGAVRALWAWHEGEWVRATQFLSNEEVPVEGEQAKAAVSNEPICCVFILFGGVYWCVKWCD